VLGYSTLAFGSAAALFLYPHSITALLAARSRNTIKRNMAALPAYTLVLALLALLGYMAIKAGVTPLTGSNGKPDNNTVVPLLFDQMFPSWFAGVAFAAIAIGALVPAAIMAIAAANLFTRNIWSEYLVRDATPAQEAKVSKITSLLVKAGAVAVILALEPQFSIDLQLIGGVLILQTLPPIVFGLLTRWFHPWALLCGWAAGITSGLVTLYDTPNPLIGKEHFGGAQYAFSNFGLDTKVTAYTGIIALLLNIVVTLVASLVLRAAGVRGGEDATVEHDYFIEAGEPASKPLPGAPGELVGRAS
jgi:SSS family solute:Na+ symporter